MTDYSKNFTIGSDPEVIITDKEGKPTSVVGKLEGDKYFPREVPNGFIHEDNVLAEMNPKPAASLPEFIDNTWAIIDDLVQIITPQDLNMSQLTFAIFDEDQLLSPEASVSGCESDLNAWTASKNPSVDLSNTPLRTAAGHIHIGIEGILDNPTTVPKLVRALDVTLGLPFLYYDTDTQRRKLYGKAGSYRLHNGEEDFEGFEYRVLSNYWLKSNTLMELVYQGTEKALKNWELLEVAFSEDYTLGHRVVSAINGYDKTLAQSAMRQLSDSYGFQV